MSNNNPFKKIRYQWGRDPIEKIHTPKKKYKRKNKKNDKIEIEENNNE